MNNFQMQVNYNRFILYLLSTVPLANSAMMSTLTIRCGKMRCQERGLATRPHMPRLRKCCR